MPHISQFLFAFMFFSLTISILYFYIFSNRQEKFVQYWVISCIFYTFSLICLISYLNNVNNFPLLEIRKIFDMLNTMCLLFGAYAFMHIPIPSQWFKYSLYLVIWVIIGIYEDVNANLLLFPVSIYQLLLTFVLCYIIYKYWDIEKKEKILTLIIFLLWGSSKAFFSHLQIGLSEINSTYLIEDIMANTLNFTILLIYLSKIQKQLFVKDNLFRIMAENAKDIIFYYQLNPFPCFSFISPSVEKITGYSANEFYNNPKLYIEIAHVDDQNKAQTLFNIKKDMTEPKVIRWYNKEGNILWIEFHNSKISNNNSVIAVQGIIRDITIRKKAEDSLVQSKIDLQSYMSYISHELKTPITSILGYVSAIKDGTIDKEQTKTKAIELILSKALTLQRLVEDLRQLSQLETKQFSFKLMQVSVSEFFDHIIDKYSWDITNANLKLAVNKDKLLEGGCDMIIDSERIEQVFSNIIFNAIKFTKENGTITITCIVEQEKKKVLFSVSDTGVGIPESEHEKIFNKFYRSPISKPLNGNVGSGLGLTIAQEIINAHGGLISVKSAVGIGSSFSFALPIYVE